MDVKYLRVMDTQQYAKVYNWSNMISRYDESLQKVIGNP